MATSRRSGPAGLAATRELLRSAHFKGASAAIVEALEAARAAGFEDLLRENIAGGLAKAKADTLDRIVEGIHKHAERSAAPTAAATEMLTALGVPATIADATRDSLARASPRRVGQSPCQGFNGTPEAPGWKRNRDPA